MQAATQKFISSYQPTKSKTRLVTKEEWAMVGPFVRSCVTKLGDYTPSGIRPYLTAMTALAVWADAQGFDLKASVVLGHESIEHFIAGRPQSQGTYRSRLRLLAKANGQATRATDAPRYRPTDRTAPYTDDEVSALASFAHSLTNEHRQVSLRALLALGLGCGLARGALAGVEAGDVHLHGPRVDELWVATQERCVPVSAAWVEELRELCVLRPDGELIGRVGRDVTSRHSSWVGERQGVPRLVSDRLRSTWLVGLLDDGASLVDVMAWSGLRQTESLGDYLKHAARRSSSCAHGGETG